jgi:hypothetical protein
VGAVLALIGFSRTWKDFRSDQKFSGVLISWVIVAGRQVVAAAIKLRFLVHQRGRGTTVGGANARVSAGANVAWKILPAEYPEDKDLPDVVRDLWERVGSLQLQMNDQAQASAKALGTTEENLGEQVARVDRQVVNVAVRGLAIQAWGLILVTVGTMLAAVPALAQISSPASPSAAHSTVRAGAHHGPGSNRSVG